MLTALLIVAVPTVIMTVLAIVAQHYATRAAIAEERRTRKYAKVKRAQLTRTYAIRVRCND